MSTVSVCIILNRTEAQRHGFFVSRDGYVITNAHVVDGCTTITLAQPGVRRAPGVIVARDPKADLALIRTEWRPDQIAKLRPLVRTGEAVATYGFPHNGLLATTGNFTLGNVTATAGLGDDTAGLQVSVPVQSGNSGGPLVDHSGNVVGVIVTKLNVVKMYREFNDLPQNVNFAIKAEIARLFMEANGVKADIGSPSANVLQPADLAESVKQFSVLIHCKS